MADRDTIIEAMARAMLTPQFRRYLAAAGMEWNEGQDILATEWATAAYDAALPRIRNAVLEEAAKMADTFRCGCCGMDGQAAAAIRALKDTP